ncbi:nuclear transport factor 2 family protein [Pseudomonas syringae]|nr:nuclear transport factor 2 family protein [Pseudomonas syringae]MBD8573837.1 nuclear transport factor 2 family protein [Pseudomonas syringae]MBD8790197.1 nuclear transport factor 2 family protein [Pseudomonas syringae]MBD8803801.1 nuclear transport factor 2 family protein [Pseudomonas syringae]MBD8810131.1 nuclear transport factor 2 family protein [Pseudomonas syringae]
MSTSPEDDYIEQAVGNYVAGMLFADENLLRRSLHPDSRIVSTCQGVPQWYTLDEFIDTIKAEATGESDFSPFWEAVPDAAGTPGAVTGNEFRQSLKLYADCVTVNRRYVTAYQH